MAKKRRSNRPRPPKKEDPTGSGPDKPDKPEASESENAGQPDKSDAGKSEKRGHPDKRSAREKNRARLPDARLLPKPASQDSRFWFGFEVTWAKIVAFRVVFFGMLALDALLQIRHAPRYGATSFNVANVPFLDELGPGRVGYGVGQLVIAYLMVLAVFGVATRACVSAAAIVYAWLYFGSQLDSYQHHYLIVLVLGLSAFVPWRRPAMAQPGTPVKSWALRLVLVQLAIMYLWAAISKLDPAWLDGATLQRQLTGAMRSIIDNTVGFTVAAVLVICVELFLAGTIWLKRLWFVAAPIGIVFHLGIVATGLEIGLFAYLMVAIYVVVLPDTVLVSIAELPPVAWIGAAFQRFADARGWVAIGVGLAMALGLALATRTPDALAVAAVASVVPIAVALGTKTASRRIGLAHVAAILMWLVVDRATSVAEDYYRFWGGSQRRLKNSEVAERAYRGLVEIAPEDARGHFQLARILLAAGVEEEGLEHLHAAQGREDLARSWLEEARWLAKLGRTPLALEKARQGLQVEPGNAEARALVDSLANARPLPAPATPSSDDP